MSWSVGCGTRDCTCAINKYGRYVYLVWLDERFSQTNDSVRPLQTSNVWQSGTWKPLRHFPLYYFKPLQYGSDVCVSRRNHLSIRLKAETVQVGFKVLSVDEILKWNHWNEKAIERPIVLFIMLYKVVPSFEPVEDWSLKWKLLSCASWAAVCFSNFLK